jgi:hypothetical protein
MTRHLDHGRDVTMRQSPKQKQQTERDTARTVVVGTLGAVDATVTEPAEVNPGPWQDLDGIYFEVGGQTYGPYQDEDAAEWAFDYALRGKPVPTEEQWAESEIRNAV